MKELTTPNNLTMLSKAWLLCGSDYLENKDQHDAMLEYIKENYIVEDEESISEGIYIFLEL